MAKVSIAIDEPRYTRPLKRCAKKLAEEMSNAEIVLLGSVASGKYVDLLLKVFADRLKFPSQFVGRGDMSRGGLMLRAVDCGKELDYISVAGAIRHGKRPPRLTGQHHPRLKWLGPDTTATPFNHWKIPRLHSGQACEALLSDGLECMAFDRPLGTAKVARHTKNKTSRGLVCSAERFCG